MAPQGSLNRGAQHLSRNHSQSIPCARKWDTRCCLRGEAGRQFYILKAGCKTDPSPCEVYERQHKHRKGRRRGEGRSQVGSMEGKELEREERLLFLKKKLLKVSVRFSNEVGLGPKHLYN